MTMTDEEFKSICQNKFEFGDCLDDCIKYYNQETGKIVEVDPESGEKVNIPEDKKHLFEMLKSAAKTATGQDILNRLDGDTKVQVVTDKNLENNSYFHNEEKHLIGMPSSENILSDTAQFMGALNLELEAQKSKATPSLSTEEKTVRRMKACYEAEVVEAKVVYEMADQYQSKAGRNADMSAFAKMFNKSIVALAGLYGTYLLNNSPEKSHDNLLDLIIEKDSGKAEQWFSSNRAQIPANYQTSMQLYESLLKQHNQDKQDKIVQTMNNGNEEQSSAPSYQGEPKPSFPQSFGASVIPSKLFDLDLTLRSPEFQMTSKEKILAAMENYRPKPIVREKAANPFVIASLLTESGAFSNQSKTPQKETSQKETPAAENTTQPSTKRHSEEIILDALIQTGNLTAEQENKLITIATELEQKRLKGDNSQTAEKFIDKIIAGDFLNDEQKDIALDASVKAEKIELGIAKLKETFKFQQPAKQAKEKVSANNDASKMKSPSIDIPKGR